MQQIQANRQIQGRCVLIISSISVPILGAPQSWPCTKAAGKCRLRRPIGRRRARPSCWRASELTQGIWDMNLQDRSSGEPVLGGRQNLARSFPSIESRRAVLLRKVKIFRKCRLSRLSPLAVACMQRQRQRVTGSAEMDYFETSCLAGTRRPMRLPMLRSLCRCRPADLTDPMRSASPPSVLVSDIESIAKTRSPHQSESSSFAKVDDCELLAYSRVC